MFAFSTLFSCYECSCRIIQDCNHPHVQQSNLETQVKILIFKISKQIPFRYSENKKTLEQENRF